LNFFRLNRKCFLINRESYFMHNQNCYFARAY
jgi:hypothetical protein